MIFDPVNTLDIQEAFKDSQKRHFHSTFAHLDAHFGVRRGCYSVYMGSTSCGKSSLLKTIIVQASSTPDVTVLVWLSEEKKAKYAKGMSHYCNTTGADLSKVKFFEESSIDMTQLKTHEDFLIFVRDVMVSAGADIVFFDNISTSRLYGSSTHIKDQAKTVTFFKRQSQDLDIAIVAICHTSSDVSDNQGRLFTTEDVRGLKSISIEASYFYALQKFTSNGTIYLTLRTLKFRDHDQASGTYILNYDHNMGVYVGDKKVDFEAINEIFKKRDSLGRK